ncbi:MAG: cusR [Chloroflexi bacterium]|jgi:two-component system response regulator MprA|nr:cusR [Chloroflexota bacterium]
MEQRPARPDEEINILVVDDEPHITDFIALGLNREGYTVTCAADGKDALRLVQAAKPDLVILDLMLPGLDGLEVCRRLRTLSAMPILLLTARDAVEDRVQGLDAGADDYLCKPFSFAELSARVRALLRRSGAVPGTVLQWADVRVDTGTRDVWRGETLISLTVREFDLLVLFLRHPRQVLTRQLILQTVWGYDFEGDDNIVEVYIRYLRVKLCDQPPKLLQTVRGVGYALRALVPDQADTPTAASAPVGDSSG